MVFNLAFFFLDSQTAKLKTLPKFPPIIMVEPYYWLVSKTGVGGGGGGGEEECATAGMHIPDGILTFA